MAQAIDQAKVEAFVGKALGDVSGMQAVLFCAIGDRLGLFKDLAANGPATSEQLAKRTKLNERYVREWAGGLANAGYLDYDPKSAVFTLPAEHEPVLAQETGPMFFGGMYAMFPDIAGVYDGVERAFKQGGGVPQSGFPDGFYENMDRFTASWFENNLLEWLKSAPEVEAALKKGVKVADVGCGRGRALIKLAEAFPSSTFVGYDIYGPNVQKATQNAKAAGLGDTLRFEEADVSKGLPETFDIIFTFDVIHDAVDPEGLLKVIRESLNPGGAYLCLDINCARRSACCSALPAAASSRRALAG
jgi:2-polyprenyl-3-methyl-5-hydroxy-6-metoxy-1,4-benzoquinol methylase